MMEWVATKRDWLSIEPLPGYAPDLNPAEQVWASVKSKELANLCAETIGEVAETADDGLDRISDDAPVCFAFSCITLAFGYHPIQPPITRGSLN